MTLRFVLAAAFFGTLSLQAQITSRQTKGFQNVGAIVNTNAMHIHTMPKNCKGETDRVYGKSGKTYYACIGEKDVCSAGASRGEKIPPELIAAFDASTAQLHAKQEEFKARQAARSPRTTMTTPLRSRPIPTRTH